MESNVSRPSADEENKMDLLRKGKQNVVSEGIPWHAAFIVLQKYVAMVDKTVEQSVL